MPTNDPSSATFPFTIGIEEEYQIIDPQTRELCSCVTEIMEEGKLVLEDQLKPELMQSVVEVGTHICRTVEEARIELRRLRGAVGAFAAKQDRAILAAGTHPFSSWHTQEIYPNVGRQIAPSYPCIPE